MKRLFAALVLLVMLGMSCAALATAVTFENLHYGQEAIDMHQRDEVNTIVFEGETYSLNDDCADYRDRHGLYGGKTRAVYEMTVPAGKFTVEDDGQQVVLGDWYIDIPYRAEMWIATGNRISGEYVVEGPVDLTETYHEEIILPRDEAGNPVLIDRIYLYRYQVGEETRRFAASLYIDYENYRAARPVAGAVQEDEPARVRSRSFPYAAIALGTAACCGALVLIRKRRKEDPMPMTPDEKADLLTQGNEMLAQLQAEEEQIQEEDVKRKVSRLHHLFFQMLGLAQSHPQRLNGLRRFVTYYLPSALKLLRFWRSAAELDVDESKRAEAHESVMNGLNMVIDACRKTLDNLHGEELLDVSDEIGVLEQMLKREGLMDSGLKLPVNENKSEE